jgi:hypothetical protein
MEWNMALPKLSPKISGFFGGRGLAPPKPEEVKGNLSGETGMPVDRRRLPKTHRTEQFNVRVTQGFKQFVEDEARDRKVTLGFIMDRMRAAYENQASGRGSEATPRARKVPDLPDHVLDALLHLARASDMSQSEVMETLIAEALQRYGVAAPTTDHVTENVNT